MFSCGGVTTMKEKGKVISPSIEGDFFVCLDDIYR
jgi:hypothetical protein